MGWERFQESCAATGLMLTDEEAQNAINAFRQGSPEVVNYWNKHERWFHLSAAAGDDTHEIPLRSGRSLIYFQPKLTKRVCISKKDGSLYKRDSVTAWQVRGGIRKHMWGGMIVENVTQALARDVMCDSLLAVVQHKDAPDIRLVMTVHDEIVFDFPEKEVDFVKQFIPPILTSSTPYMAGCPLDTEWGVADKYGK